MGWFFGVGRDDGGCVRCGKGSRRNGAGLIFSGTKKGREEGRGRGGKERKWKKGIITEYSYQMYV